MTHQKAIRASLTTPYAPPYYVLNRVTHSCLIMRANGLVDSHSGNWSSDEKSSVRRRLLRWFDRHQRDLPWRKKKSPYRTWVSEIMLQQTQVSTVIDYFHRFIDTFPDIASLAQADLEQVLQQWEGLGYYRRARQLHATARQIVDQHGGKFPESIEEVLALPGIGRYTAGAILSIALDQPHPILEGNTLRLFARLLNLREDVKATSTQKKLWAFSESMVTRHRPGDLNQAWMELGSLVCTVHDPSCTQCPLQQHCRARLEGEPRDIPIPPAQKVRYEDLHEAAILIVRREKVLLRKCQPGERWADLWDFPRFSLPTKSNKQTSFLERSVQTLTGLQIQLDQPYSQIKHAVTKYRIRLDCYRTDQVRGRLKAKGHHTEWVSLDELSQRPLSVTGRKMAKTLLKQNA